MNCDGPRESYLSCGLLFDTGKEVLVCLIGEILFLLEWFSIESKCVQCLWVVVSFCRIVVFCTVFLDFK